MRSLAFRNAQGLGRRCAVIDPSLVKQHKPDKASRGVSWDSRESSPFAPDTHRGESMLRYRSDERRSWIRRCRAQSRFSSFSPSGMPARNRPCAALQVPRRRYAESPRHDSRAAAPLRCDNSRNEREVQRQIARAANAVRTPLWSASRVPPSSREPRDQPDRRLKRPTLGAEP